MIAPIVDYVPIRVNIRFLTKERNSKTDVTAGRIAPPPTPHLPLHSCSDVSNQSDRTTK